jgi:hypothetical protein
MGNANIDFYWQVYFDPVFVSGNMGDARIFKAVNLIENLHVYGCLH